MLHVLLLLLLVRGSVAELLDFLDLLYLFLDEAREVGRLVVVIEKAFLGQAVLGTLRLAMYPLTCFRELYLRNRRLLLFVYLGSWLQKTRSVRDEEVVDIVVVIVNLPNVRDLIWLGEALPARSLLFFPPSNVVHELDFVAAAWTSLWWLILVLWLLIELIDQACWVEVAWRCRTFWLYPFIYCCRILKTRRISLREW